jgi:lysophospholipase L1-like esterase
MFVNLLRNRFPSYEMFNLSHRGYGTDQELLTFVYWHTSRKIRLVVLMFSANDIADNNYPVRSFKPKPHYQLVGDELVLTGVPVPKTEDWSRSQRVDSVPHTWREALKNLLMRSHFLHDAYFRYALFVRSVGKDTRVPAEEQDEDLTLTARLLAELKKEVEKRGAKLLVVLIASKREIERLDSSVPYQRGMVAVCQQRGIDCLDLAPAFGKSWHRTFYRFGGHWNARGNQVAAQALGAYLALHLNQ